MWIFLIGTTITVLLVLATCRLHTRNQEIILNLLAILLPLSEIGKQLLLTRWNGSFLWWYLPFQLCSMPLYLLPVRQLLRRSGEFQKVTQLLTDFLADFGLLGGLFTFADQSGMHYALPILTLHSYLWHFIMIYLGLLLILSGRHSRNKRLYPAAAGLFLCLAAVAQAINFLCRGNGSINMFYISLWEPVTQAVFNRIAQVIGTGPEVILYLSCVVWMGYLFHLAACRIKPLL